MNSWGPLTGHGTTKHLVKNNPGEKLSVDLQLARCRFRLPY